MFIPPTKPTYPCCLFALALACAAALTPGHVVLAQEPALPVWDVVGARNGPDASLFPPRDDIFQGGNNRPQIAVPSSMFDRMPSAADVVPPAGVFQAVGGAVSQVPAIGQVVGAVGAGMPAGVGDIARTVQAGAQVVGAVGAVGSVLGQFQRGSSGAQNSLGQNAMGAIGNVVGVGQGYGSIGQGYGSIGTGMGAGPFGQFMGQNNQIMQGMQFIALLQQLFGGFLPTDSALQFNNANTGESARTAFVNLMGTNSGSLGSSPSSPPSGPCDNSAAYQEQYQRVYESLEGSRFIGTVPEDGAQYGITTGSREEWAHFYTRLARVESGFNPNTSADINGRREGTLTSFGVYQMGRPQFETFGGGDIHNANDNTNAFVRYAESMYFGTGSYGAGGGQNRLAGRDGNRWLGLSAGYGPLRRTSNGSQNSNESFLLASNMC